MQRRATGAEQADFAGLRRIQAEAAGEGGAEVLGAGVPAAEPVPERARQVAPAQRAGDVTLDGPVDGGRAPSIRWSGRAGTPP